MRVSSWINVETPLRKFADTTLLNMPYSAQIKNAVQRPIRKAAAKWVTGQNQRVPSLTMTPAKAGHAAKPETRYRTAMSMCAIFAAAYVGPWTGL